MAKPLCLFLGLFAFLALVDDIAGAGADGGADGRSDERTTAATEDGAGGGAKGRSARGAGSDALAGFRHGAAADGYRDRKQ